ncbi:MAG: polynucleotide adenylyltransferase, partial [Lachnospiraceae bacterium]|nr:polynucleotide adenylyltransferase [Lachnospiraceae bacterium]
RDLIALGMMPGREIGTLLDRLLEIVLEEPERNTRDELLRICAEKNFLP